MVGLSETITLTSSPFWWICGSGNFEIPWARMQPENRYASRPGWRDVGAPADAAAFVVVDGEEPPQAARDTAVAKAVATNGR